MVDELQIQIRVHALRRKKARFLFRAHQFEGRQHCGVAMRGYISAALSIPSHVQNLVVRDYCERTGLTYEMAEVENRDDFAVLERVLTTKPEGIVAYSLEQFDEARLAKIRCPLHFA